MFGATLQAAVTILIAASLATYVQLRAGRTPLRAPLVALLGALIVWSGGSIWRLSAHDVRAAFIGFAFGWIGIAAVPPLWVLLAARYARVRAFEKHPRLAGALFVPSGLIWLAVATSPWQDLMYRHFSLDAQPIRGPLFFVHLFYAYAMVVVGVALYLRTPRRTTGVLVRRSAFLLASAALLPSVASGLFVFHVLPVTYDPTPGTFALSLVIFTFGVFRYQLLDALPLARGDAVDFLHEAVLITDGGGGVIDANRAATALLGRTPAAARGLRLAELLEPLGPDPEDLALLEGRFESLAPDAVVAPVELLLPGDRRIEVGGRCLRSPRGDALGRVVVLRDRTEERRHEAVIRRAQKLETVGRLVAGVAHEVNNPLAFVRANLNHLQRVAEEAAKHAGAEPARSELGELAELPSIVAECLDGIDRIKRIVDAMRRFSRSPGSDDFAAVDVNDVVRVALRIATVQCGGQIRIETRIDPVLPPIQGSASRLEQVVVNLLLNSAQALAPRASGVIRVATRRIGPIVEIEVCDDGPGIGEQQRERIFDPFFTTKGPEQGTGLGLSIAHDIVREHGGVLELRPTSQPGACFVASLPIEAP
jgi:signal transduction histidine kinase